MPTNIGNKKAKLYLGETEISGGGVSLLDNTATFKSDNIQVAIHSVASGNTIQAPTTPAKTGYVFKGWGDTASSTNYYTFPWSPTVLEKEFNAVWEQATTASITGLGNSGPSTVIIAKDAGFPTSFEEWTDQWNNVFIKIPTIYRKVVSSSSGQITAIKLATAKLDNTYEPYPCFVKEDGVSVMPYICIGKYMMSSTSTANSVNATYVSMTVGAGRTLARQRGEGYQLFDWQMQKLFQDLGILARNTIDTNNGSGFDSLMGIYHQKNGFWVDGVASPASGNNWVFSYKPSKYVDSPSSTTDGYQQVNYARPTATGNITKLGYDTTHPFFNYPSSASGSSYTSYYCDQYYHSSGSHPVLSSVGYTLANHGVFYCFTGYGWSDDFGVRLCYRPITA